MVDKPWFLFPLANRNYSIYVFHFDRSGQCLQHLPVLAGNWLVVTVYYNLSGL